jgi:pimeloyl-ACP methyl ester carboxylesterase
MRTEINRIKIDYRDEGSGPAVIFIHAFPLNQSIWDDQVAALKQSYRTITLDLRGFGSSDAPAGPYSMEEMAADVRALMTKIGLDDAVFVGLSMGGYISLAFYRSYPEQVRALVLADTRASADNEEGRERRMRSAERAEREGAQAIAGEMLPMLLAPETIEKNAALVARVRAMIESNSPSAIASAQRAMAGRPDSSRLIERMNIPVLVIVGSEDSLTKVEESKAMSDKIPGSRLRVIEGAGHLSNVERPAEFNRALADFLDAIH